MKMPSYAFSCKVAALLSTLLFVSYFIFPAQQIAMFGIPASESGEFVARRTGILLLGFAILCWSARTAPPSHYRTGFCVAAIVATAGLAVLGLYELARGFAGPLILIAVAIEILLAALFARHVLNDKSPDRP